MTRCSTVHAVRYRSSQPACIASLSFFEILVSGCFPDVDDDLHSGIKKTFPLRGDRRRSSDQWRYTFESLINSRERCRNLRHLAGRKFSGPQAGCKWVVCFQRRSLPRMNLIAMRWSDGLGNFLAQNAAPGTHRSAPKSVPRVAA